MKSPLAHDVIGFASIQAFFATYDILNEKLALKRSLHSQGKHRLL